MQVTKNAFLSIFLIICFISAISFLDATQKSITFSLFEYIPLEKIPVLPLLTFSPTTLAISSYLSDITNKTFVKYIPSKNISIIFPIRYIAITEYNPISTFPKNITFKTIIIVSAIIITLLLEILLLYALIIYDNKSVPPVEAAAFKIKAVPIPIIIPPYIQAKNLSFVTTYIPSK